MGTAAELGYSAALAELRNAQKPSKGAPAYSLYVNRVAGRYLAAAAYRLGMTPNQVTAVSAVFTFAGIAAILLPPAPLTGVLIALLLLTGYALDSADGQLARLRGGGTYAGEWLDHVIDSAKISTLHLAVLVALYLHAELPALYLVVPIGFQVVAAVMFFTMILNDQLRRRARTGRAESTQSVARALAVSPTDYGVLCLAFVAVGFTQVFAVIYAALFAANTLFLTAALVKWARDIAALDARATPSEEAAP